jgi:cell division protein FtsW (lipid II flippase)
VIHWYIEFFWRNVMTKQEKRGPESDLPWDWLCVILAPIGVGVAWVVSGTIEGTFMIRNWVQLRWHKFLEWWDDIMGN